MSFTPYALELIINYAFTTSSVTRPTSWYLAWHTGSPGDAGSANEQTTGGDANYARQAITIGSISWSSITKKGYAANTNTISITPAASTSYDIYGFSIWDALTSGNCLVSANSKLPISVSDLNPLSLGPDKIPITLSRQEGFGRTSYGTSLMLNWLFTTNTVTRPTAWYVSLHTADPGDNGATNEITTGDDPDYVRKATTFDAATTISNSDTYTRSNLSAIWVPGTGANFTAPYAAIHDAVSAGNCLMTIACSPPRIGVASQTLSIAAKEITIVERV